MIKKTCNPKSAKANDPNYTCKTKTGRWNLVRNIKKLKTCNPKSAKANDPNYICNPETGRWNIKKKKIAYAATGRDAYRKQKLKEQHAVFLKNLKNKTKTPAPSLTLKKKTKSKTLSPAGGFVLTKSKSNKWKAKVVTPDRREYRLPVRNYRCVNASGVFNCSRVLSDIKLIKKIGEGTFGQVFTGTAKYKNLLTPSPKRKNKNFIPTTTPPTTFSITVKVIKNVNLDKMNEEVEFSYFMGENKLGPKIYDSFFVKTSSSNNTFTQYIIMESFDMNVRKALTSNAISYQNKKNIIKQMIALLKTQMFVHGLECYDIKPSNYVYNVKDNQVKLIDFGIDWCRSLGNKYKNAKDLEVTYIILLTQLATFVKRLNKGSNFSSDVEAIFRGYDVLYKKHVTRFQEMIDLLKKNRNLQHIFKTYTKIPEIDHISLHRLAHYIHPYVINRPLITPKPGMPPRR
jgi:hypothetical protein